MKLGFGCKSILASHYLDLMLSLGIHWIRNKQSEFLIRIAKLVRDDVVGFIEGELSITGIEVSVDVIS